MQKRYKVSDQSTKEDTLIFSGLIGVDVVGIFTLLTLDKIDVALTVSVYCSAIAIPFLAFAIYAITCEVVYEYTVIPWYVELANVAGTIASVLALGAIFWHFSWIVASIFGLACLTAIVFTARFHYALDEANKKKDAA